ncbi:MAG: hypothetical protein ACTHMI_04830 [Mucilaginibacter sp.]
MKPYKIIPGIVALTIMIHTMPANAQTGNDNPDINTLELRNYVIKPGQRDNFIKYFAAHFVQSQIDQGGYPMKWSRVKNSPNSFFWMRGFKDMASRSKFLPAFYYGPVWKQFGKGANDMLANNDNVYLLKPLALNNGLLTTGRPINSGLLKSARGIAVVDFYIANTKLDKLIAAFAKYYLPAFKTSGITNYTLWVSEMQTNDFPRLPVFQDPNLLVAITFYNDEQEYRRKQTKFEAGLSNEVKAELQDIITIKNTIIIYPAQR